MLLPILGEFCNWAPNWEKLVMHMYDITWSLLQPNLAWRQRGSFEQLLELIQETN
jgi:hypothetical protein